MRLAYFFLFNILLITAFSILNFSSAKVNLRHSYFNKQFVSQLEEGTYEVVHPFQIRDKKERIGIDTRNFFLNATTHYKQVVIVIRSNSIIGNRIKLILSLNDYLFFDKTRFKKLDYDGEAELGIPVENCYYQGTVNGDPSSFVAISTCNGLWGLISFNGTTLGIWPLDGGDRGRRHPHVLYQTKWSRDGICGAITHVDSHSITNERSRDAREVSRHRHTRFMKLVVIGDYEYMKEFNLTEFEAMNYILNTINIVDLITHAGLGVHMSVVYSELWLDSQRVELSSDLQQTLSGTLEYVTGNIYHIEKDASLLFTGGLFANGEALTSTFASVCTSRAVGIVKATDPYTTHATAIYATHALTHVLGVDHDSSECHCETYGKSRSSAAEHCIMQKQTSFMGAAFITKFSKCSTARMRNILSHSSDNMKCLLTRPFQRQPLYQCGNGIVDSGEECDCGDKAECTDPCCDALTCTLRPHAKCASHQQCCHRCELRPTGHICRPSRSSCDVAELCDGRSGDCPSDSNLVDGIFCGLSGHCWRGDCLDSEHQCRELWGPDSKPADDLCYTYNQKGVEYGNCGRDQATAAYLPCSAENLRCGMLHCTGGKPLPLLSNLTSFNLQFLHDSRQIQCKVVTGSLEGMVKDGTGCAQGNLCIDGVCLPLAQVSPPINCPSNNMALQCSGHGDCTTSQTCICFDGWTGLACDVRSNSSRRLHNPTRTFTASKPLKEFSVPYLTVNGKPLETATLLGILFLVGIFLLLLLICLLLCYRRKSTAELYRSEPKVPDEDSAEDLNRAIKFGQMPSYREEKQKRRRNKLVYDALQRINEANEDRDSASPKSRESSSVVANGSTMHRHDDEHSGSRSAFVNSPIRGNSEILGSRSQLSKTGSHSSFNVLATAESKYGSLQRHGSKLVPINPDGNYSSSQNNLNPFSNEHYHQHQELGGVLNRGFTPPLFSCGSHYRLPGNVSPTRSDFHHDGKQLLNAIGATHFTRSGYSTDTELSLLRNTRSGSIRYSAANNSHNTLNNRRKVMATTFNESPPEHTTNLHSDSDAFDSLVPPAPRLQSIQVLMNHLNGYGEQNSRNRDLSSGEGLVDLVGNQDFTGSHLSDLDQSPYSLELNSYDFYPGPSLPLVVTGFIHHSHSDPQHPPSAPSADSGHPGSTFDVNSARDSRGSPSLIPSAPEPYNKYDLANS